MSGLRIGVDVGGTSTDAVLLDGAGGLLARAKRPTTADPLDGIAAALRAVVPADAAAVGLAALGTTQALNAVLTRRGLGRVAVLRLAAPATLSVPLFAAWPADLRAAVDGGGAIVRGGVEVDGRVHPLDRDEILRVLDACGPVDAVAIAGVFSVQSPEQELEAAAIVHEALGDAMPVSLGHRVGGIGLLERENAAILNAALGRAAERVAAGFAQALADCGVAAEPFLTQNDGTLLALDEACRLPVLTIGGGAANSIRGAAALTGLGDALVVDVGGTSTDVGAIAGGSPRESAVGVAIGGVQTNFRMPDVISVALGGGSVVHADGTFGPDSVGARIGEEALVFGGATPTLTDASVAAGRIALGDPALAGGGSPAALARADALVADAVDRMKLARGDVPVIGVGGGSGLLPDRLPGCSAVVRPGDHDVANAIGAATSLVGGDAEVVAPADGRAAALEEARAAASARAEQAGADPGRLETVRVDDVPLAYTAPPLVRIRVKVAGPARAAGPAPARG